MKRFLVFLSAILLCFGMAVTANAVLIDFESTGLSEEDPLIYEIPGLTFINAMIAEEGAPTVAFKNDDTVSPGEPFGGIFITDPIIDGNPGSPGTIEIFFGNPVFSLSFQVADIDGEEEFTAQAYDATGKLLEKIIINAGDPDTGGGIATFVQFSASDISSLTMRNIFLPSGNTGWGVDNLSYNSIPDPSAVFLLGSASLIGLAGLRRKLKK